MSDLYRSIQESADFLRQRGIETVDAALVLGSGLGAITGFAGETVAIPFDQVPHFAPSTVDFHVGRLLFGKVAGIDLCMMEGRLHYYEGYTMGQVVHPIRTMRALGAETLILTSAVGGIAPSLEQGDLVAVSDHINLMGDNPLIGPNDDRIGPRFPDMSEPYGRELLTLAERVARERGINLKQGVLTAVSGPSLETAAEYRFLRRIGADLVGMSMVPENIAAVHAGMKVLGISVVTDLCDPDNLAPVDIPEILRVAAQAEPVLQELVLGILEAMNLSKGD